MTNRKINAHLPSKQCGVEWLWARRNSKVGWIGLLLTATILSTCNKNNSTDFGGSFYIMVPLIENSGNYLNPSPLDDQVYLTTSTINPKRLWKLIPVHSGYNIAPADSVSILITCYFGTVLIQPKDSSLAAKQTFAVVHAPGNPGHVLFQSLYSGKFIQVDYCYKGMGTWGYNIPVDDSSYCGAYGINLSSQADTCYCVKEFVLEKN